MAYCKDRSETNKAVKYETSNDESKHELSETTTVNVSAINTNEVPFDVTIRIGESFIQAHKEILCRYSPYFKAMFSGPFAESKSTDINLTDTLCSKEAFVSLLEYMYTGNLDIKEELLMELVDISSILLVDYCLISCCRHLKYSLNFCNALRYWLIIYRYFENYLPMPQNLLASCFHNYIIHEADLLDLSADSIVLLFSKGLLKYCTNAQIAKFLLRWFKQHLSELDLIKLLKNVKRSHLSRYISLQPCSFCKDFHKVLCSFYSSLLDTTDFTLQATGSNLKTTDSTLETTDPNRGSRSSVERLDKSATVTNNSSNDTRKTFAINADYCVCFASNHLSKLRNIPDLDSEIDVLLVAGPSYETLNHKFDLFIRGKEVGEAKCDSVELLHLSAYVPMYGQWFSIGAVPCLHNTLKQTVEFADHECSIHYCDNKLYFRKASKEALVYDFGTRKIRGISLAGFENDASGGNIDGLVKFVGSFVVGSDLYAFVTPESFHSRNNFYIVRLTDNRKWVPVMGPFALLPPCNDGYVFDVVTYTRDLSEIYVMLITKGCIPGVAMFSGHVLQIDLKNLKKKTLTTLGEYLVEPFHWNISAQRGCLHLVHKATVMYTLDMEAARPEWRANEVHVCLEGYLPRMRNSRCGQLVCQSVFTTSRTGLWIVANRKVRGKFSVGCLSQVDLSSIPHGSITEHPAPPYSSFTFASETRMSARLLRRCGESYLYHRYPIWE